MIIRLAHSSGMIKDEEKWKMSLSERKDVAHSYNENRAMGIIKKTKEYFIDMFEDLEKEMRSRWL